MSAGAFNLASQQAWQLGDIRVRAELSIPLIDYGFRKTPALGDIRRDPPRLILGEQLVGRSAPRLILEINIRERLSVFDRARQAPRRRRRNFGTFQPVFAHSVR